MPEAPEPSEASSGARPCWSRSIAIARIRITPVTTCCQKLETAAIESPFWSVPMKSTPTAVPVTPPSPPRKLVPPSRTAAAASSGVSPPTRGLAAPRRPAWMTPPIPATGPRSRDQDERPGDVDSGEACGGDVAADGVDVPAEVGPAEDDEGDEVRRRHDPDRIGRPRNSERERVDERGGDVVVSVSDQMFTTPR